MLRFTLSCIVVLAAIGCSKFDYNEDKKSLNNVSFQFNKHVEKGDSADTLNILTPDWRLYIKKKDTFTKKEWMNYLKSHFSPGVIKIITANKKWIVSNNMAVCISEDIWKWKYKKFENKKYLNISVFEKQSGKWYIKYIHLSPNF